MEIWPITFRRTPDGTASHAAKRCAPPPGPLHPRLPRGTSSTYAMTKSSAFETGEKVNTVMEKWPFTCLRSFAVQYYQPLWGNMCACSAGYPRVKKLDKVCTLDPMPNIIKG